MNQCKSIGCTAIVPHGLDFCSSCNDTDPLFPEEIHVHPVRIEPDRETRHVGEMAEIDIYAIHHLFELDDPSGCLHAASSALLLSGQGDDTQRFQAVRRAHGLLGRWLELNNQ